jgi:hypothetical protein
LIWYSGVNNQLSKEDIVIFDAIIETDFVGFLADSAQGQRVLNTAMGILEDLKNAGKVDKDFMT